MIYYGFLELLQRVHWLVLKSLGGDINPTVSYIGGYVILHHHQHQEFLRESEHEVVAELIYFFSFSTT
jgi:hypothetical protein